MKKIFIIFLFSIIGILLTSTHIMAGNVSGVTLKYNGESKDCYFRYETNLWQYNLGGAAWTNIIYGGIPKNQYESIINNLASPRSERQGLTDLLLVICNDNNLEDGFFQLTTGGTVDKETIRKNSTEWKIDNNNNLVGPNFPPTTSVTPSTSTGSPMISPTTSTSAGGSAAPQQTWSTIPFTGLENPSRLGSLGEIFSKYLPQIIGMIGGFAFMIVLAVGGFLYITSGGDEEQAVRGKKTIMWAVIGIIVISVAYAVIIWFRQQAGFQ